MMKRCQQANKYNGRMVLFNKTDQIFYILGVHGLEKVQPQIINMGTRTNVH